ncbi:CheR family methyltransferase [Adhaeribacter radiodurans]|uniref:protein-glutamate O-methyltransferase n=1 Tax=Adhaeribacter radiodurans TaxID=2745197 RepID=A0A7L7L667_9BACT|nr:CheR family methyltransferase [Adhaeribacter radiodurans]QMU28321.1 PAS domain-containing protein [Adhaeribacter radiodurans]
MTYSEENPGNNLDKDKPEEPTRAGSTNVKNDPFVVGIGASAGGLQALQLFFEHTPPDSVAYVVVQHLAPESQNVLSSILKRQSVLLIADIQDSMPIEENRVYIMPAGKHVIIRDNVLYLTDRQTEINTLRSIDLFFKSLATDKGKKAIGVILSGTGNDGAEGVTAIKKAGGLVVVQDPETAKFDGMPRNAIQKGHANFVLPPELMPEEIFNYVKVAPLSEEISESIKSQNNETIEQILGMVHDRTGLDFHNYKRPTIIRRLSRRMAVTNQYNLVDYLDYLQLHLEEVETISREFLIGVTKFFRDEDAFEVIEHSVIPDLIDEIENSGQLRIWVAGCSTGEEAYSLAILVREYLENTKKDIEVKVFASDIDRNSLEFAGKGLYPYSSLHEVSEQRILKYFVKEEGKYRVCQQIRKMVIFAPHNIISDPPFSKINLVSCRNMLIYLNPLLQKKVMAKFHYALQKSGYLFLGSSESVGDMKNFVEINKKWKIFRNTEQAMPLGLENFSVGLTRKDYNPDNQKFIREVSHNLALTNHIAEALNETLLEELGYAAVYVDENFNVMHGAGNYNHYLTLPDRALTMNLLKMVPADLALNLGTLLRKAVRDKEKITITNVQVRHHDVMRRLNLVIKPYLEDRRLLQKFILVLFSEEVSESIGIKDPEKHWYEQQNESRVSDLELELQHTKEDLQAVVEELETSNEELQSTNEELLSSNEELQSTNEELQSLNEELHTINAEHQYKIKLLMELDDDLNNYFRSTNISQIFVDRKLEIRKYTPSATQQINLIESDIGRSIYQISNNLIYNNLIEDIREVIVRPTPIEKEVQDKVGTWYLMRVMPYITQDGRIDGAIIIFIDINEIKSLQLLHSGILNSSVNLIQAFKSIRNQAGQIVDFEWSLLNAPAQEFLKCSEFQLLSRRIRQEFPDFLQPDLFNKLVQVVETEQTLKTEVNQEYEGKTYWFYVVAVKLNDGLVLTFNDITDRKLAEEELETNRYFVRQIAETSPDLIYVFDLATQQEIYVNRSIAEALGYSPEEFNHNPEFILLQLAHPDDVPRLKDFLQKPSISEDSPIQELMYRVNDAKGQYCWFRDRFTVFKYAPTGEPLQIMSVAQDVTGEVTTQEKLKHEKEFSESLLNNSIDGIVAFDMDARITAWNTVMEEYNGLPREEVLGKSIFELFPEYRINDEGKAIQKALEGEKTILHDHPYGLRQGYYETITIPLFDNEGKVMGGFSIIHDITERKRLEDERINTKLNQQKEILNVILETQESERKRISEALHNGLGQLLYATKLKLSDMHPDKKEDKELQTGIDTLLNDAIRETRQLSFELMPSILRDFGLAAAIQEICKRVNSTKIQLQCEVLGLPDRLDEILETAIFRICQELLNNILKHSQATEASIQILNQKTKIVLRVEDNGIGFDPEQVDITGLGLSSIRNRLQLIDGTLDIDSEPGKGSLFTIKFNKTKLK